MTIGGIRDRVDCVLMPSEGHLKLVAVVIGVDGLDSDNPSEERRRVVVNQRVLRYELERRQIDMWCTFADGSV